MSFVTDQHPGTSFTISSATPDDSAALAEMIVALARYEKLEAEARPDATILRAHLAEDARPRCEALIAHDAETDEAVGFALFFPVYSTFLTNWGIHLEDLFVRPAYRGKGIGFALLKRLAQLSFERGCERLEWAVLDWNQPAIDFYDRLGAEALDDWTTMRLSGAALKLLGSTHSE